MSPLSTLKEVSVNALHMLWYIVQYLSSTPIVHSLTLHLITTHLPSVTVPFSSLVLSIHHVKRSNKAVATQREVHVLKMKLQDIMKGVWLTQSDFQIWETRYEVAILALHPHKDLRVCIRAHLFPRSVFVCTCVTLPVCVLQY